MIISQHMGYSIGRLYSETAVAMPYVNDHGRIG